MQLSTDQIAWVGIPSIDRQDVRDEIALLPGRAGAFQDVLAVALEPLLGVSGIREPLLVHRWRQGRNLLAGLVVLAGVPGTVGVARGAADLPAAAVFHRSVIELIAGAGGEFLERGVFLFRLRGVALQEFTGARGMRPRPAHGEQYGQCGAQDSGGHECHHRLGLMGMREGLG